MSRCARGEGAAVKETLERSQRQRTLVQGAHGGIGRERGAGQICLPTKRVVELKSLIRPRCHAHPRSHSTAHANSRSRRAYHPLFMPPDCQSPFPSGTSNDSPLGVADLALSNTHPDASRREQFVFYGYGRASTRVWNPVTDQEEVFALAHHPSAGFLLALAPSVAQLGRRRRQRRHEIWDVDHPEKDNLLTHADGLRAVYKPPMAAFLLERGRRRQRAHLNVEKDLQEIVFRRRRCAMRGRPRHPRGSIAVRATRVYRAGAFVRVICLGLLQACQPVWDIPSG